MNENETAPFDPDYLGLDVVDIDSAYSTPGDCAFMDIPERFVYDLPMDEHGLAEMAGPARDALLDELDSAWSDYISGGF
jgi:hypothetical protein